MSVNTAPLSSLDERVNMLFRSVDALRERVEALTLCTDTICYLLARLVETQTPIITAELVQAARAQLKGEKS